ncbi:hypothetical protein NIES30_23520 [Phormidium tenue NIES-30]|uniref:Uncharacterized protein n=2 Tax=Phormidium tenue TaxID=126344 RepID=A0A1U7IYY6_9CYAN|nr:hypothetical protein NIES30_23520 [Phormidium tenue NIES-30]
MTSPILLANPDNQPGREWVRHILLGSPNAVEQTVFLLHVLNYIEQARWSQEIYVPENGLTITPRQGEVMRYLVKLVSENPLS